MPKKNNAEELDAIIHSVAQFPNGATLKQIQQKLSIPLHPRTLQRRLALLVQKGHLTTIGLSRSIHYQLPLDANKEISISESEMANSIPLSPSSVLIQELVNQPIQARTPVGYNRNLLDDYQPNVTSYLPPAVSKHLLELGKTDGKRPAGTYAREIYHRLLIDLSWNSSRLEGNSYSLLETERLLELSEVGDGKDLTETQMILNHKAAIEFLINSAENVDINRQTILNLHALLSDNLLKDPSACGRIRSKSIGIAKSTYLPLIIPSQINECFDRVIHTAKSIQNPFEQAFFLMVHLPYLQPFEDVNKRVSRLAANIPMIRLNLSPLSFMDVPQKTYIDGLLAVYEFNRIDLLRDVFIWAYERSCALYSTTCQMLGEPDPFRLRYRNAISETVANIVRLRMDKKTAVAAIKKKAADISPKEEPQRFIETVEIELRSLHEGNIARYRLTQAEYLAWNAVWNEKKNL